MKTEKKIFLDKNDGLDRAVGELVAAEAEKIILNIPKDSVLGASVHNFQVLERESETAGKELAIESVDDRVLELASLATIPAVNPVFKIKERVVADILPGELEPPRKAAKKSGAKKSGSEPKAKKPMAGEKLKREGKKKAETAAGAVPMMAKEEERSAVPEALENIVPKREFRREETAERLEEKPARKKTKRGPKYRIAAVSALAVVFAAGYFAVTDFLPKATVSISIQKTKASFSDSVAVDTSDTSSSASGSVINLPGQLMIAKGNLSMSFPATGSSTVGAKAGGVLTVYNNYSAQPQVLVATTRFQSPEGKIFRLLERVTIPGAKVSGGKIIPSSIDVRVAADRVGADYNVPPSQNWRIPGFSGTPRYGKFYAEARMPMTGGASGNRIVPTQGDVQKGKTEVESALAGSLKSQTLILSSRNLKLLDNASALIATSTVNGNADKDGNFSIFAAGELRQLVFDEEMLKNAIVKLVVTSTMEMKLDEMSLNYATSAADLASGKMTFSVSGELVYEPKIDFDAFKAKILGLDADSLKASIFSLPGLQKANISFWPFWVNSVPTRASRVNMAVE